MDKRRLLAAVFVVLCLSLSGLLMRRQFAAHPAQMVAKAQIPALDVKKFAGTPAPTALPHKIGAVEKAVIHSIKAQLAAIRTGDADKAMYYQSTGLRRNFASPQAFVQTIATHYPEFGHCRSADFSPVRIDPTGEHAVVVVTCLGEDGRRAQGYYIMVKENGVFRVAGVQGGNALR